MLIAELSKEFDVSEVTIRNDLENLEQKKSIDPGKGGSDTFRKPCGYRSAGDRKEQTEYA